MLVIGGSVEAPGSVLLAATAALRAGAGRVRIATTRSIAPSLAVAVPEARVTPMAETADGVLSAADIPDLADAVNHSDAVLVGPGMVDKKAAGEVLDALIAVLPGSASLVADAAVLGALSRRAQDVAAIGERTVLLPNSGEMTDLLGSELDAIDRDPVGAVQEAVRHFRCTVALRGGETFIAGPGSEAFVERAGHAALATSGSGDVLSGALAGLSARGVPPLDSTLWAVHAHACAGASLADRLGGLGLLARELCHLLPTILNGPAAANPARA